MAQETLPVALELMFGSEGGYSNRKTDRGGPTKYGVTAVTLAAYRGVSSVAAADVEAMTIAAAWIMDFFYAFRHSPSRSTLLEDNFATRFAGGLVTHLRANKPVDQKSLPNRMTFLLNGS